MLKTSLLLFCVCVFTYMAVGQCVPGNFSYKDTCLTNVTSFKGIGEGDPSTWKWNFGDPSSGKNDSAFGAEPTHLYATPGSYTVTFNFPNACNSISKTININNSTPITLSLKDTIFCDTPFVMDAGIPGLKYLWSSGDTVQQPSLTTKGKYWVKVYKDGCYATDTIDIKVWGQGNKGNYNWYFGNQAGLNFKDNPPSIISNSKDTTYGGATSISDPVGKILLYTDGNNIYNKNNEIMQGGAALAGIDSSQATLIVPDPRANNIYYVVNSNKDQGLTYSIVDLSFNNGLGKVTQKNVPLFSPATAQIAGVKDSTDNSFWIVTHGVNTNEFISYRIGKAGLDTNKVVSNAGSIRTGTSGYIKFSEDGALAAVTMPEENRVEIFSFDKSTGKFTLKDTITNIVAPFGVEFSGSNSKLYISTQEPGNSKLFQYNLSLSTDSLIMASKYDLTPSSTESLGALQMGPDQKIYVAVNGSNTLSIINTPDQDSLYADYQQGAVSLSGTSGLGLTNFVANHFKTSDWSLGYIDTCLGMTTTFLASAPDSVTKWVWSFGDGVTVTTTEPFTTHKYNSIGSYNFSVTPIGPCVDTIMSQTLHIIDYPIPSIQDATLCTPDRITLDAGNPGATYLWSTGSTDQTITTDTSGTYSVTVSIGQCATSKTVTIKFAPVAPFDLGANQTLCNGDSIVLDAQNPNLTHNWSNGANTQQITVKTQGTYSVTVTNGGLCPISDNIQITFIIPPTVSLGPDDTLCAGQSKNLIAGSYPGFSNLWSTGETGSSISVQTNNAYSVKVYQGLCASYDTVNVTFLPPPTMNLIPETSVCTETQDSIVLNGGAASAYLWTPGGETTQTITVKTPAIYTLIGYNAIGCPSLPISTNVLDICEARIAIPTIFSPNGDGKNDEFKIAADNLISFHLELYNRWGELIFVSDDINKSWNGEYRGQIVEEGAYIWKVTYTGESITGNKSVTKTGDVTVIK